MVLPTGKKKKMSHNYFSRNVDTNTLESGGYVMGTLTISGFAPGKGHKPRTLRISLVGGTRKVGHSRRVETINDGVCKNVIKDKSKYI